MYNVNINSNFLDKILIKEIISPILIILLSTVVYALISKVIKEVFKIRLKRIDVKRQKTISSLILNIIKYFIIIIALFMILDVYGIDTKTLIASLGVVGLAIGLALQDILKDLISGLSIIIENQYHVGDIVTIGTFKGEVIELGMKTTKLKSYTGEVKIISNRNITEVINHNLRDSVAVIELSVPYGIDIEKTEEVLSNLAKKLSKNIEHLKGEIKVLGIERVDASRVYFKIVADTESLKQTEIQRILYKEFKLELDEKGLTSLDNQVVIKSE